MKRYLPIVLVSLLTIFIISLFLRQDGEKEHALEAKAVVLSVDNSEMVSTGIAHIGFQTVEAMITEGRFKGTRLEAANLLLGQRDVDEIYSVGDRVILALLLEKGEIRDAKTINLVRQWWELGLFALFILLLIIFARFTGLKALFSFVASLYILWKIFIPALLGGASPMLFTVITLSMLTFVIIFAVAGFNKKGLSAFLGTMAGLAVSIVITIIFGRGMNLLGMTQPFAETLIFSGHYDLDMRQIFYASVIIGASGAAMDVAMDVAASMHEIKVKRPDISMKELIMSGFNVGRAVVGTMTTTLLLAYSGGYLTMLMLFVTKDTSFMRIMNYKMVAAEIFRTLTGSIGLVMVAPFTAIVAGWIYSLGRQVVSDRSPDE